MCEGGVGTPPREGSAIENRQMPNQVGGVREGEKKLVQDSIGGCR